MPIHRFPLTLCERIGWRKEKKQTVNEFNSDDIFEIKINRKMEINAKIIIVKLALLTDAIGSIARSLRSKCSRRCKTAN